MGPEEDRCKWEYWIRRVISYAAGPLNVGPEKNECRRVRRVAVRRGIGV